ncbi:MAG: hypothetical protein P1P84_07405 [Deferrisomatales bacterium]|nr:hypothetical protein [Deferrisomatales bacterium]
MERTTVIPIAAALVQNLALLVALAAAYQAFLGGWTRDGFGRRAVAGLVASAVAVAAVYRLWLEGRPGAPTAGGAEA